MSPAADAAGIFLTARWQRLAMLNFDVDPAVLRPFVPGGTQLDDWHGRHVVSVVGFQFLDTRVLGVGVPFHRNFLEVNLRFYVRRIVDGDVRRGVVFVKELVPRAALALVANAVYNERYEAVPMTSHDTGERVEYRWEYGGRTHGMGVSIAGDSIQPEEGSEEAFITEHYWGYVTQRDGTTMEYRVEHPQWRVWRGVASTFDCDVAALYGESFAPFLRGTPASCFLADGSDVVVRKGVRISTASRQ